MAKSPHTTEWKIAIIKKYLTGEGSYESIANAYSIVGFRCIMPIWNSKITNRNGRSIWQKHAEKLHWKSAKKL